MNQQFGNAMAKDPVKPASPFSASLGRIAAIVLGAVVVAGIVIVAWTWSLKFKACPVQEFSADHKAALQELSDIVKWTLTLSVGFIGLFGSLGLGLKEAPRLTPASWLLLMAAMLCFAFAIYFALMWRTGVAQAYLNQCPMHISSPMISARFDALTYFFLAGIGILAALLCSVIVDRNWRKL